MVRTNPEVRTLFLIISVYSLSLLFAPMSDAPRRRLVVTGDSARIEHRHSGPQFKVSSERQIVIVRLTRPGIKPTTSSFQVERSSFADARTHALTPK